METRTADQAKDFSLKAELQGKRVAMVTFSPYPADPRPRRTIDALVQQGMTVDLLCLRDEKGSTRERAKGLNIRRLPVNHRRGGKLSYAYNYGVFILLSAATFALRALRGRYDLVYVHNMPDILVLSALVPKMLGAKVILDLHDPMPELMTTIYGLESEGRAVRFIKRLERWSIGRADLVLTVNEACRRIFTSRSCDQSKIGVVMNSPDENIFAPRFRPSETNHPGDRFVIMYHGSLVERNGLDLGVEALQLVRDDIPTAELRIYGRQTPFLDRVMRDVRDKGLTDRVHYFGSKSLEEITQEIAGCDVGIIPNHSCAFADINTPTRIFEYLAIGKPPIVPRTLGIRDYFDERSIIYFEPGSVEDLANKIRYAFANRTQVKEIVRRGQEVYCKHTWNSERSSLIQMVAGLLEGKCVAENDAVFSLPNSKA